MTSNEILIKAIAFANKAHKKAVRKGTDMPYIIHPMEVMQNLYLMKADKKLMAAGVLHDVVEDTDKTIKDIKRKFGKDVALLVLSHTEQHKEWTWEKRKETAMAAEEKACRREKMLVLADKLSNIRAMHRDYQEYGDELWQRFNRGKEKQSWYYHKSTEVLKSLADYPEIKPYYDEFCKLVEEVFC